MRPHFQMPVARGPALLQAALIILGLGVFFGGIVALIPPPRLPGSRPPQDMRQRPAPVEGLAPATDSDLKRLMELEDAAKTSRRYGTSQRYSFVDPPRAPKHTAQGESDGHEIPSL